MPLTQAEKDQIRELESYRAEVRKEINPPEQPKSRLSKFFGHEAVRLVLGFILTTVVGGLLTYFWKQQEWQNQQRYLARQKSLEKRYALMEDTFKSVASTTAAAQDVLNLYYGDRWTAKDIDEREANWQKTSREWRISANLLDQSLGTAFTDQEIENTFHKIVVQRQFLGNDLTNLPAPKVPSKPRNDREKKQQEAEDAALKEPVKKANDEINEILKLLHDCGSRMKAEVQAEPGS